MCKTWGISVNKAIDFTCSNCFAGLVHCQLASHVHENLGLWASLYMCGRHNCCWYHIGIHCHTISLKFLQCSSSTGRADHGQHPSCLTSGRNRDFCLRVACHCPVENNECTLKARTFSGAFTCCLFPGVFSCRSFILTRSASQVISNFANNY